MPLGICWSALTLLIIFLARRRLAIVGWRGLLRDPSFLIGASVGLSALASTSSRALAIPLFVASLAGLAWGAYLYDYRSRRSP